MPDHRARPLRQAQVATDVPLLAVAILIFRIFVLVPKSSPPWKHGSESSRPLIGIAIGIGHSGDGPVFFRSRLPPT